MKTSGWKLSSKLFLCSLVLLQIQQPHAFTVTSIPPLLDVPTYSLSTLSTDNDGTSTSSTSTTNMNIVTYATPISIRPDRVWSIGLFKGTLSHQNFVKRRCGILQLLKDDQSSLVKVLGGRSGMEEDVDKQCECASLGFPWAELSAGEETELPSPSSSSSSLPLILPGCAYYMHLTLLGEGLIDAGSHDMALCRVDFMVKEEDDDATTTSPYLSTGRLRKLGIITEQGRVAD